MLASSFVTHHSSEVEDMSYINTDLDVSPTKITHTVPGSTSRRISYSEVTTRSTFFDDEDNSDSGNDSGNRAVSDLNTDLDVSPTKITHTVPDGTSRRISYSEVTTRSTFFDDKDNSDNDNSNNSGNIELQHFLMLSSDNMETAAAAEEIQRHWRGKHERARYNQCLREAHNVEVDLHNRTASKHTEEGLVLLEQSRRTQSKLDQEILAREKKRAAKRQGSTMTTMMTTTNQKIISPGNYHTTNKATEEEIDRLVSTFRRCLATLCQNTHLTSFDLFDLNRDGHVTRSEFRRAVMEYDFAMSEIEM